MFNDALAVAAVDSDLVGLKKAPQLAQERVELLLGFVLRPARAFLQLAEEDVLLALA